MQLRWGILGATRLSHDFCQVIKLLSPTEHEVVSISDENLESAKELADLFDDTNPNFGTDDNEVVKSNEINVVYIGSHHNLHRKQILLALENGKHVLCDKPLGLNVRETKEVVQKAKEKKLFLMEGFGTKFFPAYNLARTVIESGEIGEVKIVTSNFGTVLGEDEYSTECLARNLGGGGLFLGGSFCTLLTSFAFGPLKPEKIIATGFLNHHYGTDDTVSVTMLFENDRMSQFTYSCSVVLENRAVITGTKGQIIIRHPFQFPTEILVNGRLTRIKFPFTDRQLEDFNFENTAGFCYQIDEVRQCLMKGETESKLMPLLESVRLAEIHDEIRRQMKVVYDQDKTAV